MELSFLGYPADWLNPLNQLKKEKGLITFFNRTTRKRHNGQLAQPY